MSATFGTPEHWRDRAEEARVQAERTLDKDAKKGLLAVAESYERIAKLAEAAQSKAGPVTAPTHRSEVLLDKLGALADHYRRCW